MGFLNVEFKASKIYHDLTKENNGSRENKKNQKNPYNFEINIKLLKLSNSFKQNRL